MQIIEQELKAKTAEMKLFYKRHANEGGDLTQLRDSHFAIFNFKRSLADASGEMVTEETPDTVASYSVFFF